jgi:hypothetical protein
MSLSLRRALVSLALCSLPGVLLGCPKKKEVPAVVDAAPPPPPVEDAAPAALVLMEEDSGLDAGDAADAKPKYTGPAVHGNVLRLKQCCSALNAEAKRMGASPEAGMFAAAATQCNTLASQVGPTGTAPELGVLRGLLAGRNIPAICGGF